MASPWLPKFEAGRVLSEFEHLLNERVCPVCNAAQEAERSFFAWFEIESHTTVEMQSRLRAANGMCPAHSRRLIEQIRDEHIMTTLTREALAGARQLLQRDSQQGPCPACETMASGAERARNVLLDGLRDPGAARAYGKHVGICLPHLLQAAATAEQPALMILTERLLTSLREEDDLALELLAGVDRDAPRRAKWRRRLLEEPAGASTVEAISRRLTVDACPVCLARGLMERHYCQWFLERGRQDDASIRSDPGELCSVHLHDVAVADRAAASGAIGRKRAARIAELERLLGRLAELAPTSRRRRRSAVEDLAQARNEFNSARYCSACHASDGVERSQLELMMAAILLVPVHERYEHGHGLCVRHAAQLPANRAGELARRHVEAWLGILAWEIKETARKFAWAHRHEAKGPEQNAWLRAFVHLDGRVLEGGPAPDGLAEAAAEGP